eukprot:1154967-Pelagomonas_calceolata.AAC.2
MEPERREADGPLTGEGSQGGARGTGGGSSASDAEHQEQLREQEVLHQQEHWGSALTKETSRVGIRVAQMKKGMGKEDCLHLGQQLGGGHRG